MAAVTGHWGHLNILPVIFATMSDTMNEKMSSFYNLADETIVHICTYLPTVDIIALSAVCQRFHLICSDKSIVRISNFHSCFLLTESLFKTYLKPKIIYNNIEILNLNYCYWLPAPTFSKIGKLKNLKELHILDCPVSFAILRKILLDHRLRSLSWTWRSPVNTKNAPATDNFDSMRDHLSDLRHLVIHMTCIIFLIEINNFLYACLNLEGFEIYNLYVPASDRSSSHGSLFMNYGRIRSRLPSPIKKLQHFKCQDLNKERSNLGQNVLANFINSFANAMAQWTFLWITESGSRFLYKWWKKEQLSLDVLNSATALNLSGSWPAIPNSQQFTSRDYLEWQMLYIKYQEGRNEGYEFALRLLNHKEELKCRKLSFDDSGLTSELLCTIASHCPNIKYLSMSRCLAYNPSYIDHTGAAVGITEAFSRVCMNCLKITHLNLTKTEITVEYSAFANLKHLTSLGISTWMLTTGVGQVYPKDHSQTCRDPAEVMEEHLKKTRMWELAEACPQLIRLAIVDIRKPSLKGRYDYAVLDTEYACISQFKQLQHLHIQDPGYLHRGAFMVHALKGCTNLITLRLKNIGIGQTCNYIPQLTCALVYAKSLKSLSILQTRLHLPATFYDILSKCSNLERFRVSLVDADPDSPNRIYTLATNLPKLNWLQMYLRSSIVSCKALEARLTGLVKERPCFTFLIQNEGKKLRSYKETGPYIYLDGFSIVDH